MDGLRHKYDYAVATAKSVGMVGSIGERDGRLFLKGSVKTEEHAALIWRAIKQVRSWRHEIIADIQVSGVPHDRHELRRHLKIAPRNIKAHT